MPAISGNIPISKAALISGSIVMGTGTLYLMYQVYTFSKQLKRFNCQVTILTERLYRAEADILHLRQVAAGAGDATEQAVISDDADDEFVDAEEADDRQLLLPNGAPLNSHFAHNEKRSFESVLIDLDAKIKEGGLEKLTYCHKHLIEMSRSSPKNAEIFWRLSETIFLLGDEHLARGDKGKHDELMSQAKKAAEKAIHLNPHSGNPHKWMAIVLGSLTQVMPVPDQIKNAFDIKDHVEKAILYMPRDALMHHIMGRWCYSVYMMSWMERKLASVLFATPPTASLEEAIQSLLRAESLDPLSSIANELYLAKAYIAKGDYKTAVKYMKDGENLKCVTTHDKKDLEEIKSLLHQYKSYC